MKELLVDINFIAHGYDALFGVGVNRGSMKW